MYKLVFHVNCVRLSCSNKEWFMKIIGGVFEDNCTFIEHVERIFVNSNKSLLFISLSGHLGCKGSVATIFE